MLKYAKPYFFSEVADQLTNNGFWLAVNRRVSDAIGFTFSGEPTGIIGGGCISQAVALLDRARGMRLFVKVNRGEGQAMFEAEAMGLQTIAATATIAVPRPICWGIWREAPTSGHVTHSFLVLEWLELKSGAARTDDWRRMGLALANMHSAGAGRLFGWQGDNFIGATPQLNGVARSWPDFFARQRLDYQVNLGRKRGGHFPHYEKLRSRIPEWLGDPSIKPALLHGDLWSGNVGFDCHDRPVIFDPAVYWGDPEADLAMTELFGGFPAAFYEGYRSLVPARRGNEKRHAIYNLYHILNHFNLFGGGYEAHANQIMARLLAGQG